MVNMNLRILRNIYLFLRVQIKEILTYFKELFTISNARSSTSPTRELDLASLIVSFHFGLAFIDMPTHAIPARGWLIPVIKLLCVCGTTAYAMFLAETN